MESIIDISPEINKFFKDCIHLNKLNDSSIQKDIISLFYTLIEKNKLQFVRDTLLTSNVLEVNKFKKYSIEFKTYIDFVTIREGFRIRMLNISDYSEKQRSILQNSDYLFDRYFG